MQNVMITSGWNQLSRAGIWWLHKCRLTCRNIGYLDLYYSHHTWEVWVYFTCSFVVIRKYNRTLSNWLHTCRIFILLLSRNNRAQIKYLHDSSLPQQELARISNFLNSSMSSSRFDTVRLGHKLCDKDDNYTFSTRISRNENYSRWVHTIFEHIQNFHTDLPKLQAWEKHCSNWLLFVIVIARMV